MTQYKSGELLSMKNIQKLYFKLKPLFTFAFILSLVTIEYLAINPRPEQSITLGWDKLNHLFGFLVLYILLSLSFVKMKMKIKVILLLIFAIQIEIFQHFIPSRSSSFLDVVADVIGIILGAFAYRYLFVRKITISDAC